MARGWICVALAACWVGLCGTAGAQPLPSKSPAAGAAAPALPPAAPLPPGMSAPPFAMPPGGPFMAGGLPCPPPGPPCPPAEPPCEGPTDTTEFKVPQFHLNFEYLYWFTRRNNLPALVTTGSMADAIPGALQQPNTRGLIGNDELQDNRQHGFRINFGVGIDDSNEYSLSITFFGLEQATVDAAFLSTGARDSQILARPFFDTANRLENADPIALPGIMSGSVNVSQRRRFYGGDADIRYEYLASSTSRLHMLAGVKMLWLEDSLRIGSRSIDLPGLGVPGNRYDLVETFSLANRFYGGQIGGSYEFRLGPVFLLGTAKLGIGVTDINAQLRARTQIIEPNLIVTTANDRALYVTPNNAGDFNRRTFALAPEGSLEVGFDFNEYVRLSAGYTYLYITDVCRVSETLDRRVNIQPVGPPVFQPVSPPPDLRTTYFWAQGLNATLRFSF